MNALEPFRFRHTVHVRFRDIDVMGHAHHAETLIYFEEARWAYWREVVGPDSLQDFEYVMAEARIRWHQRVLWPQDLSVGVRVSRLGRKSFDMEYEVSSADGTRLSSGSSVQVMFDYERNVTIGIPDPVRAALESFDGPFGS